MPIAHKKRQVHARHIHTGAGGMLLLLPRTYTKLSFMLILRPKQVHSKYGDHCSCTESSGGNKLYLLLPIQRSTRTTMGQQIQLHATHGTTTGALLVINTGIATRRHQPFSRNKHKSPLSPRHLGRIVKTKSSYCHIWSKRIPTSHYESNDYGRHKYSACS